MKAQLLSLFLLTAPLVMNVVNSETTSDEIRDARNSEATAADSENRAEQPRESKREDRGSTTRAPEQHAVAKPVAKPAKKKTPAGRDYWFM